VRPERLTQRSAGRTQPEHRRQSVPDLLRAKPTSPLRAPFGAAARTPRVLDPWFHLAQPRDGDLHSGTEAYTACKTSPSAGSSTSSSRPHPTAVYPLPDWSRRPSSLTLVMAQTASGTLTCFSPLPISSWYLSMPPRHSLPARVSAASARAVTRPG